MLGLYIVEVVVGLVSLGVDGFGCLPVFGCMPVVGFMPGARRRVCWPRSGVARSFSSLLRFFHGRSRMRRRREPLDPPSIRSFLELQVLVVVSELAVAVAGRGSSVQDLVLAAGSPLMASWRAPMLAFAGQYGSTSCSGRGVPPADAPSSTPRSRRVRRAAHAATSTGLWFPIGLCR